MFSFFWLGATTKNREKGGGGFAWKLQTAYYILWQYSRMQFQNGGRCGWVCPLTALQSANHAAALRFCSFPDVLGPVVVNIKMCCVHLVAYCIHHPK